MQSVFDHAAIGALAVLHARDGGLRVGSGNGLQSHMTSFPGNMVYVPWDTMVGTIVGMVKVTAVKGAGPNGRFALCEGGASGSGSTCHYVNSTPVSGCTYIFPSAIQGVGIKIFVQIASAYDPCRFVRNGNGAQATHMGRWHWYIHGDAYWGTDLVVTDAVAGWTYNRMLLATVTLDTLKVPEIRARSFQVNAQDCTFDRQPVNLGTQMVSGFGGVGSTIETKNFGIEASSCPSSISAVSYGLGPINTIISDTEASSPWTPVLMRRLASVFRTGWRWRAPAQIDELQRKCWYGQPSVEGGALSD